MRTPPMPHSDRSATAGCGRGRRGRPILPEEADDGAADERPQNRADHVWVQSLRGVTTGWWIATVDHAPHNGRFHVAGAGIRVESGSVRSGSRPGRRAAADLDVGDLVAGHEDPAALGCRSMPRVPSLGHRLGDPLLDLGGVLGVSSTISRGACCTPILTSMGPSPLCLSRACLGAWLGGSVLVGERVAADPAPGQTGDQCRRVGLADRAEASDSQNRALTWAIPTSDTASSRDSSSGRPVSSWMTVGDHRRALAGHPVDAARGRRARWSGRTRRPAGKRPCRRRRTRRRRPSSPATRCLLSWVDSRAWRQLSMIWSHDGVEQREVEVELAGEVLVEHRLGDPRALGDVVHRRGVVALGDEDLEGRLEQLDAPLLARQPTTAWTLVRPSLAHAVSYSPGPAVDPALAQPTRRYVASG